MFLAGSRIGPYQIVGRLGAGGMGEVYRARDPRLDRSVAVKVLTSSRGSTPEELERFEREARAIARVSHPNICTVYDVGQDAGVPFLVMELLDGETLAERVLRGPVPIDAALAIATQIAEALGELHSKGVVHRDLHSSNVMLTAVDQAPALRPRQAERWRVRGQSREGDQEPALDRPRDRARHAAVHGARAGRGTPGRRSHRHLCSRCRPVRNDHGACALSRHKSGELDGCDSDARTAPTFVADPDDAGQSRPCREEVPFERSRRALAERERPRVGTALERGRQHGSPSGDWPSGEPWTPPYRDGDRGRAVAAALIAAAVWAVGSGQTWQCRSRSHSSIHSSDVPCGNAHGRPIRSRRRLDRL